MEWLSVRGNVVRKRCKAMVHFREPGSDLCQRGAEGVD